MLQSIALNYRGQVIPFVLPASDNQVAILTHIFENKCYPRLEFLADVVDTVIDGGANVGAAAVYLALAYPKARVFAYEPVARTFELLRRNVAGFASIEPIHAGLADRAGEMSITQGGIGGETSSLFPNFEANGVREMVALREAGSEFVRVAADRPGWAILKLDTEGMELPILEKLAASLARVAAVHLEYHSEADRVALDRLLVEAGFALFAGNVAQPHRGELTYVRATLIAERTRFARYAIARQ